ncbi:MAG TPA: MFS transporter, partial [Burkholderiales bacterium]|nr:MFS transporter [Burkholderiales bacterium]
ATARWLGIFLGPGVGGGLMLALGPAHGILINALIYLPIVLWLWKAPYGPRFRKEPRAPVKPVRGLGEIAATIRDVSGNRIIVSMILLAGSAAFFVGHGYQPQMPEFAHDLGRDHAGALYSMLLGANAAGAFIAGIALESRGLLPPNPRTALVLAVVWCLAIVGFATSTVYVVALPLLFVAGFLELSFNAMAMTLVQLHAPASMRGRVIGLYNMAALGMRAFSGVTIGVIGGLIGIHWSLALSAVVLLAIILTLFAFSTRPA